MATPRSWTSAPPRYCNQTGWPPSRKRRSRRPMRAPNSSPDARGHGERPVSFGLMLYELLGRPGVPPCDSSLMAAMERAMTRTTPAARVVTAAAAAPHDPRRLRRTLTATWARSWARPFARAGRALRQRAASGRRPRPLVARRTLVGRAPSIAYRTSRFVRRHCVAVGRPPRCSWRSSRHRSCRCSRRGWRGASPARPVS